MRKKPNQISKSRTKYEDGKINLKKQNHSYFFSVPYPDKQLNWIYGGDQASNILLDFIRTTSGLWCQDACSNKLKGERIYKILHMGEGSVLPGYLGERWRGRSSVKIPLYTWYFGTYVQIAWHAISQSNFLPYSLVTQPLTFVYIFVSPLPSQFATASIVTSEPTLLTGLLIQ